MNVDWQTEIKVLDLAGLAAAVEGIKAHRKRKNDEESDERGDLNGLIGRLISGGSYDRCTVSKVSLSEEKIGEMRKKVELVCFRRKLTSAEVIRRVQELNKYLASPAYILAIGFLYPDEQKEAPIVQLDPSGELPPIVLSSSCYGRSAVFGHFDGPGWPGHSRFVVVDESSDFIKCAD